MITLHTFIIAGGVSGGLCSHYFGSPLYHFVLPLCSAPVWEQACLKTAGSACGRNAQGLPGAEFNCVS